MIKSTRSCTSALLAVALLAIAAAGTARAAFTIETLDKWTIFGFDDVGALAGPFKVTLPRAGYVLVTDAACPGDQFEIEANGQSIGLTSKPSTYSCDGVWTSDPEQALTMDIYSHGAFPLPAGTSNFQIKTHYLGEGGGAYLKIGLGELAPPSSGFKVVTAKGKVATRTAAAAACEAAGMTLADVTSANWNTALDAVRASPDIKTNPMDSVVMNSWNGDSYGGVNLQLTVTSTGGAVSLLTAPAYPLCQAAATTLKAPATTLASGQGGHAQGHA
ncbi:hypothetical protein GGF32_004054 [Allomyces javanicus]|nr:hypothetical protein GGF32_004054 [Allomyces javanicus]